MNAFCRFLLAVMLGFALQCRAQSPSADQDCSESATALDRAVAATNRDAVQTGTFRVHYHRQPVVYGCWLDKAYAAYQRGDYDQARLAYRRALRLAPKDIDALLGLAAVAVHRQQPEPARSWYQRVLVIAPDNVYALTGLAVLEAGSGLTAAESQIKTQLGKAAPDAAALYAALGNLYGRQNRWPLAQKAYFEAFARQRDQPDYAYNLAVSLDRLGKSVLARRYYEQALELSQSRHGNFPAESVRSRLQVLAGGAS